MGEANGTPQIGGESRGLSANKTKTGASSHAAHPLFPMFLKLSGVRCAVAGAGAVAESKIAGLLAAGARVRVAAPRATRTIQCWARNGKVVWHRRLFRRSDLRNCLLVVAATSSPKVHEQICKWARQSGVLCNVVDVPALCDFYYPAALRRGSLQIAVSTAGESPALAQRLRKEFERQFGPEYRPWLKRLGASRRRVMAAGGKLSERKQTLHKQASAKAFEAFRKTQQATRQRSRKGGRSSPGRPLQFLEK